jgi:N-acetylmuramoyl-L-alanine amidase
MNSVLLYLLQVILASGILYCYYHFFLRNKRFHRYNRFYILTATVISILVPFLNIPVYFTHNLVNSSLVLHTLSNISTPVYHADPVIINAPSHSWFSWQNVLYATYILIATLVLIRIILSLRKIRLIIKKNSVERIEKIRFVITEEPGTPFSFFRWLFWNKKIELQSEKGEQIFRHELFHIEQKHSWDILFMELLTVIFWINPFFHLMKKELKAIHEFLADQFAISENQKWEYAELLLMQALNTQNHLTNPFFHNQIKRRIAMLTTSTKAGHQYLRKVLVLPVAAIVLALFAFKYKTKENSQHHLPTGKTFTVVIDAGHGGAEPGATGSDGVLEKNIVLAIAQKVKLLNADDNLKIVLTRDADATIPLQDRTTLSNTENAELFISLHINAQAQKNQNQNAESGIEVYIPTFNKIFYSENRILASILLNYFSQLYTVNRSIQHRDKKIWILENTNCPSAMVELGYMNNNDDLHFIEQTDNQDKIAKAILQTIDQYFLQKESDDWEERKKDVIDTVSVLSQIAQKQGLKTKGAIIVGGTQGNSYSLVSDSIIFKSDSKNPELKDALIILNGKKIAPEIIFNKTVIAKSLTVYPQNDSQAISKFGVAAKKGVLIFEDAKLENLEIMNNTKPDTLKPDNKIFVKVEVEPSFPGGEPAWKKYLERHLSDFNPADKGASNGVYTVFVQFVVDKEGYISDVKALTHYGYGMEDAAINVIKKGPRWVPAMQNGEKVKAYKKQPVNFVVASNNSRSNSFNNTNQPVLTNNPAATLDTSIAKNMAGEKLLVIDSKVLGLLKDHIKALEMKNVISITLLNEENAIKKYGSQGKNGAFEFYTFKSDPKDYTYPTATRGIQSARVTFNETDVPASFPGGDAMWKKYLSQTLGGYNPADSGAAEGSYKVIAQFIVDIDGSLINIKALTHFGYGMENKVIEMLENGPKWIPAMKNGRKVPSFVKQPVNFVIQDETEDPAKQ